MSLRSGKRLPAPAVKWAHRMTTNIFEGPPFHF